MYNAFILKLKRNDAQLCTSTKIMAISKVFILLIRDGSD